MVTARMGEWKSLEVIFWSYNSLFFLFLITSKDFHSSTHHSFPEGKNTVNAKGNGGKGEWFIILFSLLINLLALFTRLSLPTSSTDHPSTSLATLTPYTCDRSLPTVVPFGLRREWMEGEQREPDRHERRDEGNRERPGMIMVDLGLSLNVLSYLPA